VDIIFLNKIEGWTLRREGPECVHSVMFGINGLFHHSNGPPTRMNKRKMSVCGIVKNKQNPKFALVMCDEQ